MKKTVRGHELKIGDKVMVLNATMGAFGANGHTGIIIKETPFDARVYGLSKVRENTILIKLDEKTIDGQAIYWRVGAHGIYELLERPIRKKHIEVDVIIKDGTTKVVIGEKVGVSKCKEEDMFNESYGKILAVAGACGLSEEKRRAIVDALYDDVKTLEDYDTLEIIDELKSRLED